MLKGIPKLVSPELLKSLCEMGHGDKVVIADGNFPAEALGKNNKVLRYDGNGTLELLTAILELMPLDTLVEHPVTLMKISKGDDTQVTIWEKYEQILLQFDSRGKNAIRMLERAEFYEETEKAYLIIATGETATYANII
ncbi:MAG TPA: fucose isomerase, partial [Lachnospiraceae bacterium]|nr:fucose isomerase [Lachnospiraceae bacterium]